MGVIYKTVNLANNKIYVGRDKHNNPKYLGSGVLLQLAIQKYGIENFKKEILEVCKNDFLDEREKFWIKELKSQDPIIGYNIADGGHNDFTMNEYVKSKISKTLKGKYVGENSFRYGIKLSEEHRAAFTANAGRIKGKTFSQIFGDEKASEIKAKISKSHSGIKLSKSHCESISRAKKGVPLTEKQRKGISDGLKGHVVTDETKEKLKAANLNKTQKHSIKIECINLATGEIGMYNNVEHARRELNCTRYQIMQNKLKGFEIKRLDETYCNRG
jgi:group I intron endonuclease